MSKFVEKLVAKHKDIYGNPPVTVAFLGDSVTQGCFEIYRKTETEIETIFDKNSAYHKYFAEIFAVLCPNVPVNIINAGISGTTAPFGLERLERDVLRYSPDLTIVCFGLNDCGQGLEGIDKYTDALSKIFDRVKASGSELIFMTPNMMCTEVSCHVTDSFIKEIIEMLVKLQNDGVLDAYIDAAKKLCKEKDVVVCDCYAKWKRLAEVGIDVTELLSNKANHPTRDMNWLFAYSLVETILGM